MIPVLQIVRHLSPNQSEFAIFLYKVKEYVILANGDLSIATDNVEDAIKKFKDVGLKAIQHAPRGVKLSAGSVKGLIFYERNEEEIIRDSNI